MNGGDRLMDVDVRIRFEGDFVWYHHLPSVQMVVPAGTRVDALLFLLGVDLGNGTVAINGHSVNADTILAQGDELLVSGRSERG